MLPAPVWSRMKEQGKSSKCTVLMIRRHGAEPRPMDAKSGELPIGSQPPTLFRQKCDCMTICLQDPTPVMTVRMPILRHISIPGHWKFWNRARSSPAWGLQERETGISSRDWDIFAQIPTPPPVVLYSTGLSPCGILGPGSKKRKNRITRHIKHRSSFCSGYGPFAAALTAVKDPGCLHGRAGPGCAEADGPFPDLLRGQQLRHP